jgi:DNA polymerase
MTSAEPSLAREFEAALAWWRAAGVDHDYADDATAWLADAPLNAATRADLAEATSRQASPAIVENRQAAPVLIVSQPPQAATVARRNFLGDSPPSDLAAFRQWWIDCPDLDAARSFPRIAPRGEVGAALMVLVPQPEAQDRDRLLAGPQGRLLDNILSAIGVAESETYIASALPCHTPMADLAAIGAGGMDAVLAHHIALARPQRLLVLGTGLATMLGAGPAGMADQPLREINHAMGNTPVMVSETLDAMMQMPRLKARFWKRWIEWSASL